MLVKHYHREQTHTLLSNRRMFGSHIKRKKWTWSISDLKVLMEKYHIPYQQRMMSFARKRASTIQFAHLKIQTCKSCGHSALNGVGSKSVNCQRNNRIFVSINKVVLFSKRVRVCECFYYTSFALIVHEAFDQL